MGNKYWRAHVARIKALPPDYRIVYQELEKYLYKVGPVDLPDGRLFAGVLEFFEEGAADGQNVLDLIGTDVAAFADELIKDSPTYADPYQASLSKR